jgi:CHAT domain-containing protein
LAAAYSRADTAFTRASSARSGPLRRWALGYRGASLVYRGDAAGRAAGEATLRGLVSVAHPEREPALAARARWMYGNTLLRRGAHDWGVEAIRVANKLFVDAGEREYAGATRYILAEADFDSGDRANGYSGIQDALRLLKPYRASVWRHNALTTMAWAAAADGLRGAALAVQNEDVAAASRLPLPMYHAEARLARAQVLAALGDSASATSDLAAARELGSRMPEGPQRRQLLASIRLSETGAAARAHPARAAVAADSAVGFFSALDNPVLLVPALVAAADLRLTLNDSLGSLAALDSAMRIVDRRRAEIAAAPLRAALLDAARSVFDRIIALQLARGQPVAALRSLERGRASVDLVGRVDRSRDPLATALHGEVAVDFAFLGDTVFIWTVRDSVVRVTRAPAGRQELSRGVEAVRNALELDARVEAVRPLLARLYDWLLRPVERDLGRPGTPLVVVADGDLATLPFAALYDARRGRYVIEDRVVRMSPSLQDAGARPPSAAVMRGLFVGDPAFDARRFPELGDLPGAAAEVQTVARYYDFAVTLADTAASRARMSTALRRSSVLHYAGHAVYDDDRPEQSFLALAPGPGDGGRWTAADIAREDLRAVRLVVLSACETGRTGVGRASGLAGLAGAFLSAGATGVVGSAWHVRDDYTRALMAELHRAYRATGDGAGALRAAQLQMLHSPDLAYRSPAAWGGFRYIGR